MQRPLPEITLRVIVLGIILSVVMGAANVYVGLKAGMTVSASIPAAVTLLTALAAIAIVVTFSLFTRPQKNK